MERSAKGLGNGALGASASLAAQNVLNRPCWQALSALELQQRFELHSKRRLDLFPVPGRLSFQRDRIR